MKNVPRFMSLVWLLFQKTKSITLLHKFYHQLWTFSTCIFWTPLNILKRKSGDNFYLIVYHLKLCKIIDPICRNLYWLIPKKTPDRRASLLILSLSPTPAQCCIHIETSNYICIILVSIRNATLAWNELKLLSHSLESQTVFAKLVYEILCAIWYH